MSWLINSNRLSERLLITTGECWPVLYGLLATALAAAVAVALALEREAC